MLGYIGYRAARGAVRSASRAAKGGKPKHKGYRPPPQSMRQICSTRAGRRGVVLFWLIFAACVVGIGMLVNVLNGMGR